jgi:hypothetical protein
MMHTILKKKNLYMIHQKVIFEKKWTYLVVARSPSICKTYFWGILLHINIICYTYNVIKLNINTLGL